MNKLLNLTTFFFLLMTNICFGQIKLDIWRQNKISGKTTSTTITSQNLPRSFESTLPDSTTDVYDFYETQPIKVEFQKGNKFLFKPLCYKSRKNFSFVTYTEKTGWQGFVTSNNSGRTFSMLGPNISKYESSNEPMRCQYIPDTSKVKVPPSGKTPSVGQLNPSDFYNPLIPINKTCKVYAEVTNGLHVALGNNQQTTIDYVTNIFLGVSYIFSREGIDLRLNKIYVWDVNNGRYNNTFNKQLTLTNFDYYSKLNDPTNPESTFKHLLSYDNFGGIAFLNGSADGYDNLQPGLNNCVATSGLCDFTLGPCGILPNSPSPPTNISNFNFNINIVSHEIGHNLGSNHTHWCGWKNDIGNFIGVLDSCHKEQIQPANCSLPWWPIKSSSVPTIMSYCYQNPVRVPNSTTLLNGFGKYPRWAIRNNLFYSSQIPFNTSTTNPILTTNSATSITSSTFVGGGQITSTGGTNIIIKGICYSTLLSSDPDLSNSFVVVDQSIGNTISVNANNLNANTTYYYRTFATNSSGVGYGPVRTFSTTQGTIPVLSTTAPFEITNSSAKSGGTITNSGGTSITKKGVCWSNTNSTPIFNELGSPNQSDDGSGPTNFTSNMSDLLPQTTYWVRSYAKNQSGVGYGNIFSFQTLTSASVILNFQLTSKGANNATTTTSLASDGGLPVLSKGVCWKLTSLVTETGLPNISNSKTTDGTGNTQYVSNISSLQPNISYTARAYVTNKNGTYYSSPITFTTDIAPNLLLKAVIYQLDLEGYNIRSTIDLVSGTSYPVIGLFVSETNPLPSSSNFTFDYKLQCSTPCYVPSTTSYFVKGFVMENVTSYVRAYVRDVFGTYYYSSNVRTFTLPCLPLLTFSVTTPTLLPSPTSRIFDCKIDKDCGYTPTENGYCWAVWPSVPTNLSPLKYSFGSNSFDTYKVNTLQPSTRYNARAYTVFSNGQIHYSQTVDFTTGPPSPPFVFPPNILNITNNSARFISGVDDFGGENITTLGFIYAIAPIEPNISNIGNGTFILQKNISPPCTTNCAGFNISSRENPTQDTLLANTTYNIKAFARNGLGYGFSSTRQFKTTTLPIFTRGITEITACGAKSGGQLDNDYGFSVIRRGVVWSDQPNPSVNTNNGSTNDGNTTGQFASTITNLAPLKQYFVKAYAVLSSGKVIYGDQKTFTTPRPTPTVLLTNISNVSYPLTPPFAPPTGQVGVVLTGQATAASEPLTNVGFYYNEVGSSQVNTVILPPQTTFTTQILNLQPSKTYSFTAFATSNCCAPNPQPNICTNCCIGTSAPVVRTAQIALPTVTILAPQVQNSTTVLLQGNATQGVGIVNKGFVVSSSPFSPSMTGFSTINSSCGVCSTGIGPFSATWTLPVPSLTPTQYYVKSWAINSTGTGNSVNVQTFQLDYRPKVTTTQPVGTSSISGFSGGNVTSNGVTPVSQRGVVYSTNPNPTFSPGNPNQTSDGTGLGTFNSSIQNLSPDMTYYVRAYANSVLTTNQGTATYTGYGQEFSFKTPPKPSGGNCNIEKTLVVDFEKLIPQGIRWKFTFQPSIFCGSYKVELSRYNGNPTTNPSLLPVQTQVLNGMNPYYVTSQEILDGKIFRYMTPQPTNTTSQPIWFSVNVICNTTLCPNTTLQDRTVKAFFLVSPP